jgi:hypothetical protein
MRRFRAAGEGGEVRHSEYHLGARCRRSERIWRRQRFLGCVKAVAPYRVVYTENTFYIESSSRSSFLTKSNLGLCYFCLVSFIKETYNQTRTFWSVFLHTPPSFCVSRISHPRPLLHLLLPPTHFFFCVSRICHSSPLHHSSSPSSSHHPPF